MKPSVRLELDVHQLWWLFAAEAHVDRAALKPTHSRPLKLLQRLTTHAERPGVLHEELAKLA
jgi:hypothetical protein